MGRMIRTHEILFCSLIPARLGMIELQWKVVILKSALFPRGALLLFRSSAPSFTWLPV